MTGYAKDSQPRNQPQTTGSPRVRHPNRQRAYWTRNADLLLDAWHDALLMGDRQRASELYDAREIALDFEFGQRKAAIWSRIEGERIAADLQRLHDRLPSTADAMRALEGGTR